MNNCRSRFSLLGLAAALISAIPVFSQVQPPPAITGASDLQSSVSRLVKTHQVWGPGFNSPNVLISLKEVSRSGPIVKYRLYAKGLGRESKYSLLSWPVTATGPIEVLKGVTLDETGLAICAGLPDTCGAPDKPNDPIDLVLSPTKGEPFRVALVSSDNHKLKAFFKIVPIPNEAQDHGCRLESVLLLPGAEAVLIEASGFRPNAELTVASNSEGERHNDQATAREDGTYVSVILPYRKGKQRGTTHLTLKSAECRPTLTFDWGKRD